MKCSYIFVVINMVNIQYYYKISVRNCMGLPKRKVLPCKVRAREGGRRTVAEDEETSQTRADRSKLSEAVGETVSDDMEDELGRRPGWRAEEERRKEGRKWEREDAVGQRYEDKQTRKHSGCCGVCDGGYERRERRSSGKLP